MPRGEKNKLRKEDIQEIIDLKGIIPARKVSLQFSISPAMVYKIWENVDYYEEKYGLIHNLDKNILRKMILTLQDKEIIFSFTPRERERYSQLQNQAVEEIQINEIYQTAKLTVIFAGFTGSGKTSVLSALQGEDPRNILNNPPNKTRDFEHSLLSFQGVNYEVYDVSGIVPFLMRVMESKPEYLFRRGRAFVFIVDCLNSDVLSYAKYYLKQTVNNIIEYSPHEFLPLGIFLHKADLISEDSNNSKMSKLKEFLATDISYPLKFYETSLHEVSTVINAFSDLIQ